MKNKFLTVILLTLTILIVGCPPPPGPDEGATTDVPGLVQVPKQGNGYYHYHGNDTIPDNFAAEFSKTCFEAVAAAWNQSHPDGPRIGYGDFSDNKGNGSTLNHEGHDGGVDADIRPVRNDGQEKPTDIHNPSYDRNLTEELIQLFLNTPNCWIELIYFNDSELIKKYDKVKAYPGHDNHLHVRFEECPQEGDGGRGREDR